MVSTGVLWHGFALAFLGLVGAAGVHKLVAAARSGALSLLPNRKREAVVFSRREEGGHGAGSAHPSGYLGNDRALAFVSYDRSSERASATEKEGAASGNERREL